MPDPLITTSHGFTIFDPEPKILDIKLTSVPQSSRYVELMGFEPTLGDPTFLLGE